MRRIGFYILYLLVGVFIFIKCTDDNQLINSEEKSFIDFQQTLETDPLFNKVLVSSNNLVEFAIDPETSINTEFDLKSFRAKMSHSDNSDIEKTLKKKLSEFTNKPNKMFDLVKQKYSYQKEFLKQNPGFRKLSEKQRKELIEGVILKKMSETKEISNISYSIDPNHCIKQREADKSACRSASYVGAASCGWFAPTLVGGVVCVGVVYAGLSVCYGHADATYDICVKNME